MIQSFEVLLRCPFGMPEILRRRCKRVVPCRFICSVDNLEDYKSAGIKTTFPRSLSTTFPVFPVRSVVSARVGRRADSRERPHDTRPADANVTQLFLVSLEFVAKHFSEDLIRSATRRYSHLRVLLAANVFTAGSGRLGGNAVSSVKREVRRSMCGAK